MSGNEYIGKVGRMPIDTIADRAAEMLTRPRAVARAVCLDPDGRVTIEAYGNAVPDDVVGVYDKTPGRLGLWRKIREDLQHELGLRGTEMKRVA